MSASTYGRQVVLPLTNKSGGGVIAGDIVVVDTTNNDAPSNGHTRIIIQDTAVPAGNSLASRTLSIAGDGNTAHQPKVGATRFIIELASPLPPTTAGYWGILRG